MKVFGHSFPAVYRSIVYLILVTFFAACTTLQPLSGTDAQTLSSQLEVGDKLEITRDDGAVLTFKVNDISDSGIAGDGEFVAYSDIRQVSIRRVRVGPTVAIVAGVVVVVAALAGGGGGGGSSY